MTIIVVNLFSRQFSFFYLAHFLIPGSPVAIMVSFVLGKFLAAIL